METVNLRGINVYPAESFDRLIDIACQRKGILVAVNGEKFAKATPELRELINDNIGYCDGSAIAMACRQKGAKDACKIAGCELWLKIIERHHSDSSFYIIGGRPEVFNETIARLKRDFPGINIVGSRDGYLNTDSEREALINDVVDKRPDFVFVAMGSPKQEFLMADMLKRHRAVYQGLGGSYDVYTGKAKRAPKWWIDHNAEFVYRLIKQPSRIKRDWVRVKVAWWLMLKKF